MIRFSSNIRKITKPIFIGTATCETVQMQKKMWRHYKDPFRDHGKYVKINAKKNLETIVKILVELKANIKLNAKKNVETDKC